MRRGAIITEFQCMQWPGSPAREELCDLGASIAKGLVRQSVSEHDQSCAVSHLKKVFVILWADWICNGDEALLVCCSVGARITYPQ